jgi:hypothetical protein
VNGTPAASRRKPGGVPAPRVLPRVAEATPSMLVAELTTSAQERSGRELPGDP